MKRPRRYRPEPTGGFRRRFSHLPVSLVCIMLSVTATALFFVTAAQADYVYSGDISPATDPTTWTSSTAVYVGNTAGNGNLTIGGGSVLNTSIGYLGQASGLTGTATVTGSGSQWNNWSWMVVGNYGAGTLSITNGGSVSDTRTYIGYNPGSTGSATIDGAGSTWTMSDRLMIGLGAENATINQPTVNLGGAGAVNILNGSTVNAGTLTMVGPLGTINFGTNGGTLNTTNLYIAPSQLSGTGTINTAGIYTDSNLVFDSSHGTTQTFSFGKVAVNLTQTGSGVLGAGYLGVGSLRIADGANVSSILGSLGYSAGSTGTATVTGRGSTWNPGMFMYVGNSGAGALIVTNGGLVSDQAGYIGYAPGSTGSVTVTGTNSNWTNSAGTFVGYSGAGTLSVTNGGTVTGTLEVGWNPGSTGIVTVDGEGSTLTGANISIGCRGNGTLASGGTGTLVISNGGSVSGTNGHISSGAGSTGSVTVSGAYSTWTNTDTLFVGSDGTGTLTINKGGSVANSDGYIGYSDPSVVGYGNASSGTASVNGANSTWTNSGTLYVGYTAGTGASRLSIGDGGAVTASMAFISAASTLTIDAGRGSSLALGSGILINNGTIRVVAGAGAANGTYTPISAGAWVSTTGTGAVQALGGVWNSTNHTISVGSAATGLVGTGASFDLSTAQRVLLSDPVSGKGMVGAGFMATSTSTPITFNASAVTNAAELTALQGVLGSGQSVLSDWTFSVNGTAVSSTNPFYLSLFAGSGQDLSFLSVWDFDGSSWVNLGPTDLAYDGTYAGFTATDLDDVAVVDTAPVPVPSALFLLGPGLAGLGLVRRRFFKE